MATSTDTPQPTTATLLTTTYDLLLAVHSHGTLSDGERMEIEQATSTVLRVLQEQEADGLE